MSNDDTLVKRPMPKRPETGWLAWQATVGYISHEYNPDAVLTVTAYPVSQGAIGWSASLCWGDQAEAVHNTDLLVAALRALWSGVEARHRIFKSLDAATRRPANYADDEWLDEPTSISLDRVISATAASFGTDWRVAITYQAVDNPDTRVQVTLFTQDGTAQAEGHGPSLRDACLMLYRRAVSHFITTHSDG